jgi:hypothetical protein
MRQTRGIYTQKTILNNKGFIIKHPQQNYTLFLVNVEYIEAQKFTLLPTKKTTKKAAYTWIPLDEFINQIKITNNDSPAHYAGTSITGKQISIPIKKQVVAIFKKQQAITILNGIHNQIDYFAPQQLRCLKMVQENNYWKSAGLLLYTKKNNITYCLLHNHNNHWGSIYTKRSLFDRTALETALNAPKKDITNIYSPEKTGRTRGFFINHSRTPHTLFIAPVDYHSLSNHTNYLWIPLKELRKIAKQSTRTKDNYYTGLTANNKHVTLLLQRVLVDIFKEETMRLIIKKSLMYQLPS